MKNIAVIISGCGHLDGAEIRESVLALLYLDKAGANYQIFAPDWDQHHVINHITGKEIAEKRNILVEAARIARGNVKALENINIDEFDGLIIPGGFGVAKNLSNIAFVGGDGDANPQISTIIKGFLREKKPIGAICIAPAMLVAAVRDVTVALVTIGEENDLIAKLGGKHQICDSDEIAIDQANKIVTCSAYMREDRISHIAIGIEKLVNEVLKMAI